MFKFAFVVLALSVCSMWGCDRCKSTAEEHLAAQKIEKVKLIQMSQQGCVYRFTGARDGRFCEGRLNIRFAGSLARINQRDRCNPESKEIVTGPDLELPPDRSDREEKGSKRRPLKF